MNNTDAFNNKLAGIAANPDHEEVIEMVIEAAMLGGISEGEVHATMEKRYPLKWVEAEGRYHGNGTAELPPLGAEERLNGQFPVSGDSDIKLKSYSEYTPRNVDWLWPGKLAKGKLTLLAGAPDTGKSTTAISMVAIASTGGTWPYTHHRVDPCDVLIMTTEDDPEDTITPRLMAAGADLSRVHEVPSTVVDFDEMSGQVVNRGLSLARDLDLLERYIKAYPNVGLIKIDPMSAYVGAKNSHSDADIRAVLMPFTQMAAKHHVAILGVAHLNKAAGQHSAVNAVSGSLGMVATARVTYMTLNIDGVMHMAKVKANVADPEDSYGLTYRLKTEWISDGNGEQVKTSAAEWTGTFTETADELRDQMAQASRKPALAKAKSFLKDRLLHGPKPSADIKTEAEKEGLASATMKRASKELNLIHKKHGYQGAWITYTPEQYEKHEQNKRDVNDYRNRK